MSRTDPASAFYSMHCDSWTGTGGLSYEAGFPSPFLPDGKEHMMLRVGDYKKLVKLWRTTAGAPPNPEFNILVSDIELRHGHDGGGLVSNHVWGAKWAVGPSPLRLRTWEGAGDINFSHVDGSVSTRRGLKWMDIQAPSKVYIPSDNGQGGDHFGYPVDMAEFN